MRNEKNLGFLLAAGLCVSTTGCVGIDSPSGPETDPNTGAFNSSTNPGATNPGATNPGTTNPGTTNPGTTNPGTTNSSNPNPGTTNPSGCDFNTSVGVKITVDTSWDGGLALQAGGGPLEIWYAADLTHSGNTITADGQVCGVNIPDFQTGALAGNETYGTQWPQGFWSSAGLPRVPLTIQLAGTEPGSQITVPSFAAMMGVNMADPLNDPWPADYKALQAADHDGDGKPGVTSVASSGGSYKFPRIDVFDTNARADEIHLALRTILSLEGAIQSCDSATGVATIAIDQHAVGCQVVGGAPCNDGQVGLLDKNIPVFQIQNASFELQRVPAGTTCDGLRTILP